MGREEPVADELVAEVDQLEEAITGDDGSLRRTYSFTVGDLVRLGEIAVADIEAPAGLQPGRNARELLDEIVDDVTADQATTLAERTVAEFTPGLLYVTGSVVNETDHFPAELSKLVSDIADLLENSRGSSRVRQHSLLILIAVAEHDPQQFRPHIDSLGGTLLTEAISGKTTPLDPGLISTFEALSRSIPAALTPAVTALIYAADNSNAHFRTEAIIALRRIAAAAPLAVRESVADLESIIEAAEADTDESSLIELARIMITVQGETACSLLERIEDASETPELVSMAAETRVAIEETPPNADSTGETSAAGPSGGNQGTSDEDQPTAVPYQARLLASHLDIDSDANRSTVIRWLQEMIDFLEAHPVDDPAYEDLLTDLEEIIPVLETGPGQTITDPLHIETIQSLTHRFEAAYTRQA